MKMEKNKKVLIIIIYPIPFISYSFTAFKEKATAGIILVVFEVTAELITRGIGVRI